MPLSNGPNTWRTLAALRTTRMPSSRGRICSGGGIQASQIVRATINSLLIITMSPLSSKAAWKARGRPVKLGTTKSSIITTPQPAQRTGRPLGTSPSWFGRKPLESVSERQLFPSGTKSRNTLSQGTVLKATWFSWHQARAMNKPNSKITPATSSL